MRPFPGRALARRRAAAILLALALGLLCAACATVSAPPSAPPESGSPESEAIPLAREFRGLWLASFMNIDWPPKAGLSASECRLGIDGILDSARSLNLNSVIVQVRPCGDALYRSSLEPWSSYLSGQQGKEAEAGFDPLQAWIDAARLRGIRVFAWVNPFRVGSPSVKSYAPSSPVLAHPELARSLGGSGYVWLDPGLPAARAYVLDVVKELVDSYDLDGLFIDDYFYPGREQLGSLSDFPDDESYAAFLDGGGALSRQDWRRRNTEIFVRELSLLLRTEKPSLPFGISPAGIWRPDNPPGIRGKDAYAESYADTRDWLEKGLADIYSPQLYWPIAQVPQSFPLLLGFWIDSNSQHRKLLPSLRLGIESIEEASRDRESLSQIMVERAMNPGGSGFILYGWKRLASPDSPLRRALLSGPLEDQALPPAYPWLAGKAPSIASFTAQRRESSVLIQWRAPGARELVLAIRGDGGRSEYRILGPSLPEYEFTWPVDSPLSLSLRALGLSGVAGPALSLDCREYLGTELSPRSAD